MKSFAIITFLALSIFASADVSHLSRQYLPPSPTTSYSGSTGLSTGNDVSTSYADDSEYVVAAPIAYQAQAYRAPATAYTTGYSAPSYSISSNQYAVPARASYRSYSAPAVQTYVSPAVSTNYLPPNVYTSSALPSYSPVARTYMPYYQQTYTAPASAISYSSPVVTYSSGNGIDTQYGANGGYIY